VQVLSGSTWQTAGSFSTSNASIVTFNTGWTNVSAIRVQMADPSTTAYQTISEIRAIGPSSASSNIDWASAAQGGNIYCTAGTGNVAYGTCSAVNDAGSGEYEVYGDGSVNNLTAAVLFNDVAASITEVDLSYSSTSTATGSSVQLLIGTSWTTIGTVPASQGAVAVYTGSWTNVLGVRAQLLNGSTSSYQWITALRALGPANGTGPNPNWAGASQGGFASCSIGTGNAATGGPCSSINDGEPSVYTTYGDGAAAKLYGEVTFASVAPTISRIDLGASVL
jgi:hypothetical protein